MRHLTTRLAPLLLFNSMGKGAGLEGVLSASGPTMPEPLKKSGANQARYPGKNLQPGRHPRGGEWPGQAWQDDPIPQGAGGGWGWVGGKCTGVNKLPRSTIQGF